MTWIVLSMICLAVIVGVPLGLWVLGRLAFAAVMGK
jgi:ABC-type proline/glycine betaine transport system permease subunit